MTRKRLWNCLEVGSFILWMLFTTLSIVLTGYSIESVLLGGYLFILLGSAPIYFPVTMFCAGGVGLYLSMRWRRAGVQHLHYASHDSLGMFQGDDDQPSSILQELIREVEDSTGYARTDVRAKAKAWLIHHVSSLDQEDILLAREHFGYLLPAGWGLAVRTS